MLFPCNQFLSQEPSQPTPALVKKLSKMNLDTEDGSSMLMSMVDVNGSGASPVFEFLKYNSSLYSESTGRVTPIPWNFAKFLVNPNGGGVYKYYSPNESLESIRKDIDLLLSKGVPASEPRKRTVTSSPPS
mmetsp:Transcript_58174/g.173067  ORF Transcript_58174/g.173067 Transcript_58174/m.173067 type:complete len:131 (+) Transcript_58174:309-701(+)